MTPARSKAFEDMVGSGCTMLAPAARKPLSRLPQRTTSGPRTAHLAGRPLDVGVWPQRRPAPRGKWIRTDARSRDGGVRQELAAVVRATVGQLGDDGRLCGNCTAFSAVAPC